MLDLFYGSSRTGAGWFPRARAIALIAVLFMFGLACIGWVAMGTGWMNPALSTWFGFSLLPLLGLIVLQTTTRLQESLTMRFGGRPVAMEGGED